MEAEFNNFMNSYPSHMRNTWKWLNNLNWALLDDLGTLVEVEDMSKSCYSVPIWNRFNPTAPSPLPLDTVFEVVGEDSCLFYVADSKGRDFCWHVPESLQTLIYRPFGSLDIERLFFRLRKRGDYHFIEMMIKRFKEIGDE